MIRMLAAFALLTGAAASAQQAAPAKPGDVVVTGRRPTTAEERKAVRHMVATVTPVGDADQPLARFQTRVCPQVNGLPAAMNQIFAERLASNAREAGLEAAVTGCRPNVTVMIVPNGKALVAELDQTGSGPPGEHEPVGVHRFGNTDGPVYQWAATELRSRDGDRINPLTGVVYTRSASIILAATRMDITGTVLVFERDATIGKTINQLADYATMRALAQTRTPPATAYPSILRLFAPDDASPPRSLTAFDRTYLKTLYHGGATQRPFTEMGIIARAVGRAATDPAPPAGK